MILPIMKNDYDSLNDGSFRFWRPFGLPIHGEYDDYGSIENIVKDKNTEALEKYFEMPIEAIVEAMGRCSNMFGDRSIIQKHYGTVDVVYTRESLAKIHFNTDENGIVTHPVIQHYLERLSPENRAVDRWNVILRWDADNNLTEERDGKVTLTWEAGEDATDYNGLLRRFYRGAEPQSWRGQRNFIWGVPTDKQERAHLLDYLQATFIRSDVFDVFVKKAASDISASRNNWDKSDWQDKRDKEYDEAVAEFRALQKVHEDYMATPEVERTDDVRMNALMVHWEMSIPERMIRNTGLRVITADRRGTAVVNIYKHLLEDPYVRTRLKEMQAMEYGMRCTNTSLIPTMSIKQHGDVSEQLEYAKLFVELGEKIEKERDC